ncbi:cytochrome c [Pseudomonas sp.]|uniref:c-type cytochrome n=1 Tax=Pseudomonas sp. TaxID=306 RepID=UPI0031D3FB0C
MKRTITTLLAAGTVGSAAALAAAYFGLVNVGADDPHFPAVHAFLAMARDRSIEVRARDIEVPNLKDETLIRTGAGNYNAMCIGCHLAPGLDKTELSQALYPAPPNLAMIGSGNDPAGAFWIIKHGIKASGMPAWGKSMGDQYIWGVVAFLEQMPQMNAEQYQALLTTSGGHQHGGGESEMHNHEGLQGGNEPEHHGKVASEAHHSHPEDSEAHKSEGGHHDAAESSSDHHSKPGSKTHTHKDGKVHTHEG